jgi:crotonobetainyl-CoA:carnitine CoA-transferase CaiB-like acyl-CoA transferase
MPERREYGYSIPVLSHRDLSPCVDDAVTDDHSDALPFLDDASSQAPGGALGGLLVADFGRVLAGPYATMLLADLGAEVIKIERPGVGDDTRAWGPPWANGQATYFQGVNRNKQSVAIDLRTSEGLAAARALAAQADVVVENFRPGVMARLGLDYETLSRTNPRLVYCSISGFGSGKGAELPGYDLLAQAVGGLMSVTGFPDGEPTKVGVAMVDVVTGLHAAVGILAAVRHAEHTGEGQRVEVNLLSSLLSALVNQAQGYVGARVVPGRMGNRHPSISPYQIFPTKDRLMVLAVGNDRQFVTLCDLLDLPEAAIDSRFVTNEQRVAHREALYELLSQRLRTHSADHWFHVLMARGVPCGPLNSIAEGFALATELGLAPIAQVPTGDPVATDPLLGGEGDTSPTTADTVANPIRLSRTPATYRAAPPRLGQHGGEGLGAQEGAEPARYPDTASSVSDVSS